MWRLVKFRAILASLIVGGVLTLPAWASTSSPGSAVPGTLNYVEGQASIGNEALNTKSVGAAEMEAGQTLTTESGKAEVLLTPGVFLRLVDNSSVNMISPGLTNTQLALDRGEALVEVDEIHPENNIRISENGASTRLLKNGLYDFDADHDQVRVFTGKATILDGDQKVTVKGGHELTLNSTGKLKAKGFDKDEYAKNDDLYRWSSLRSDYLAEANVNTARTYVVDGWYGPGWWGAGWYWSPWSSAFTFIPADGFLYSPFGWGFYSPLAVYRAPVYGSGNYYHPFQGFKADPIRHSRLIGPTPAYGPGYHGGAVRSFHPVAGGGFHGVPAMHGSGGFHAGLMGGFHGGEFRGAGVGSFHR